MINVISLVNRQRSVQRTVEKASSTIQKVSHLAKTLQNQWATLYPAEIKEKIEALKEQVQDLEFQYTFPIVKDLKSFVRRITNAPLTERQQFEIRRFE